MKASKRHKIRVEQAESVKLLHRAAENGMVVNFAFGPNHLALIWEEGEEMPESVRQLLMIRGVLNENTDGGGI